MLRRQVVRTEGGVSDLPGPSVFGAGYPHLEEFITRIRWEDGTLRVPGSITVFSEEGVFKVWLNDKDARVGCCISAGTLDDLWEAVERVVQGDGGDWRRDKGSASGKGRK